MLTFKDLRKNLKIRREKPQIWLLEKEKVGYIQIPKVATRSIQHAMVRHLVSDSAINDNAIDKKLIKTIEPQYSAHMSLRQIRRDIKGHYFLFGFVRNPVTRIYSCYKNKVLDQRKTGGRNILSNHGIHLDMDFPAFVDTIIKIPDRKIDRHLRSLAWFLSDAEGLVVDYVGKLETFRDDWEYLRSLYGLQIPVHHNKSSHARKMSTVCSKTTLEKIIGRYTRDIELFGYQQAVDEILREYQ
ncbi:MAG: hypothetical protein DRQ45_00385 [Gammaproteobacteria bacterium]|nr:MAG: hypothetical protein DRQ45_00385 [Gammaproteobacteria bacterium]